MLMFDIGVYVGADVFVIHVDADWHHDCFSLQVKTELHDIHPPSVLKSNPHLRDPSKLNARLEAGQCARAEFALRQCAAWSAFIYLAQG